MSQAPQNQPVYKNARIGNALLTFGVCMFALFLVSAYLIATSREAHHTQAVAIGSIWIVGVPIFFFFEHVVLFRKYGDPDQYEGFKRGQELAGKIWAGAIVVMTAFFTDALK